MLQRIVRLTGGDPNKKEIWWIYALVDEINALESRFEALSDEAKRAKTDAFRGCGAAKLQGVDDEKERAEFIASSPDDRLPKAFAAGRQFPENHR